ncbi:HIT family protein [Kangiella japonica]|uniref:HIT family protein n=1 Tax=Kangiella japonica TaxID=647384 RepID=A0ABN0T2S5_9GAMM
MDFKLDARLERDCILLGNFELCQVLLMNDANYPWLILVPRVSGIRETYELSGSQKATLMKESNFVLEAMAKTFNADKMNLGALGNIVPQLHIHHIVRYETDLAWPAPVWGKVEPKPYSDSEREAVVAKLNAMLSNYSGFESTAQK